MHNVWMQEATQRRIKPVGLFIVIAGSLDKEMLVPDVTISVKVGWYYGKGVKLIGQYFN